MRQPSVTTRWNLDHSYRQLSGRLYTLQQPEPVPEPELVCFNKELADELGLDLSGMNAKQRAAMFSGNRLPDGSEPLAQAYAGHQFGHFTMLGDGRALLLGEQIGPDGRRHDIQFKGSGRTPYSRSGDGRGTLSSMLREYLMSEALHHLGIPTSRSLAVTTTGDTVYRQSPRMGGILTRVATSHIRVGTFEYVRRFLPEDELRLFTDYVIARHDPELTGSDQPALELLKNVTERQIALIVGWMRVGFIHGVMNTDNMAISGETIDYGPCAFMNAFDPHTVFSSIDMHGRYAFANQPNIAQWNLSVLAGALLPLISTDTEKANRMARDVLEAFPDRITERWYAMMGDKLGLAHHGELSQDDCKRIDRLLDWMHHNRADYTNTFLALSSDTLPDDPRYRQAVFIEWHKDWLERVASQAGGLAEARKTMRRVNPAAIPRNHLVEEALEQAATDGDLSQFESLLQTLRDPYTDHDETVAYQHVPEGFDAGYQTFCGT